MNANVETKKYIKYVIIAVAVIAVIGIVFSCFYTLPEAKFACVLRFSEMVAVEKDAGLHFKIPFIDEVKEFPKTKLICDLRPSEVYTSDSKAMTVDSFIIWRISDPLVFYKSLQTTSNAEERLNTITYTALKNTIGTIMQNDLISSADEKSRDYLNNTITEKIMQEATAYGIEILDIKVKKFELPTDNEQAVFRRMISDRTKISELYIAEGQQEASMIRNRVDKEVNIIKSDAEAEAEKIIAEGESEYMKILAEAYNTEERRDFYIFMRGLDALKASLTGGEKTVILDKDSELAKILIKP